MEHGAAMIGDADLHRPIESSLPPRIQFDSLYHQDPHCTGRRRPTSQAGPCTDLGAFLSCPSIVGAGSIEFIEHYGGFQDCRELQLPKIRVLALKPYGSNVKKNRTIR